MVYRKLANEELQRKLQAYLLSLQVWLLATGMHMSTERRRKELGLLSSLVSVAMLQRVVWLVSPCPGRTDPTPHQFPRALCELG